MKESNIIFWLSESGDCPVADFIRHLPAQTQSRVIKRSEYYQRLRLVELLQNTGFLEKIKGNGYPFYELKYRISPPYRAIGFLWKDRVVLLKIFQGSGSNGKIGRQINNSLVQMADNWKTRFK